MIVRGIVLAGRYTVVAIPLPLLTLTAALGGLYLMFKGGLLAAGPSVPDALSLEQLAGNAGQPLARFAAAWGLAGFSAGSVLAVLGGAHGRALLAVFALGAAIVVAGAGALSDALTNNQQLIDHVTPQLVAPANLLAWAAVVVCAAVATVARARLTARV